MKSMLAMFLGITIVYWFTSAGHYIGGDQAIFVTVAVDGGYAHAPGYPLYSMYLYATNWGDNPWLATSRATAVLGALAASILYRAMRAWAVPNAMAIFATLIWAFAPQVWFYHTQAEVFAGNNLAVAAILWACAPGQSKRPTLHTFALGLLAGLAISHHHTAVFMAPLGLWKTWTLVKNQPRNALLGILGLATGLLPYLWLPYVHIYHYDRWHWGAPDNLDGFLHVFLRKDYGTFTMTVDEEINYILMKQWLFLISSSSKNLLGFIPFLAIVATLWSWKEKRVCRASLAALTVCALLSGPFFVALMHREPVGINSLLVSKFHLMFITLVLFLAAVASHTALNRLRATGGRSQRLLAILIVVLTGAVQLDLSVNKLVQDQHPAPHYLLRDVIRSMKDNFLLVAYGDHLYMGTQTLVRQEGLKGRVIAGPLLQTDWYVERLRRKGFGAELAEIIDYAHKAQTNLYFTSLVPQAVVERYPHFPTGVVMQVNPRGHSVPSRVEVFEANMRLFDSFDNQILDESGGAWTFEVAREYAQTWYLIKRSVVEYQDLYSQAALKQSSYQQQP